MNSPEIRRITARHSLKGVLLTGALLSVLLGKVAWGQPQVVSRVIVVTGHESPGGGGRFVGEFGTPVLNDLGQIAFLGTTSNEVGVQRRGIFRGNSQLVSKIAFENDAVPDGNGSFDRFGITAINNSNQVMFQGRFKSTAQGSLDDSAIFRAEGDALTQLVRAGDMTPDHSGPYVWMFSPTFNHAGAVAFAGHALGQTGMPSDFSGSYIVDEQGVAMVARQDSPAPAGDTFANDGYLSTINQLGQVAFHAGLKRADGSYIGGGLFRGDETDLVEVIRPGMAAPDENGVFTEFSGPALNDRGEVAFQGYFTGTTGGTNDDGGIYVETSAGLIQVAREGQAVPNGNGVFGSFRNSAGGTSPVALNNAGDVVFEAALSRTSNGNRNNGGLYIGDGQSIMEIVREGATPPDGKGYFIGFGDPGLNHSGQVGFVAALEGAGVPRGSDFGLYSYDRSAGLVQIARTGDRFLGSTLTTIRFNGSLGPNAHTRDGFNERGELAYYFMLLDGREGIAIATLVPEAKTLVMLIHVVSAVAMLRRIN